MWTIRQQDDQWEVLDADGAVVEGGTFDGYAPALAFLASHIDATLAMGQADGAESEAGLLPEWWEDVAGICMSITLDGGRDFSRCQWSWRDPNVVPVPLMLQTENAPAHATAKLAGFAVELHGTDTVHASGRFYDNEAGRAFRDMLLGGRRFGVSVDPSEHVVAEWECVEEDEEGFCVRDRVIFTEYELAGISGVPFQGMPEAAIQLRGTAPQAMAAGVGAPAIEVAAAVVPASAAAYTPEPLTTEQIVTRSTSAGVMVASTPATVPAQATRAPAIPVAPPAAWFNLPEPQPGDTGMVEVYGMPANELLIEQRDGSMAVPLTILDNGQVFGHLAARGNPHTGFPGRNVRVPISRRAYADFNLGVVVTAEGERLAAGMAVFGCEHAPLRDERGTVLGANTTRDFYAHSGAGWGQLRITEGEHGPWACGALLPDVTEPQLRVLRALTLSGDWREIAGALELIGVLAVNVPGFRITREAMVASGVADLPAPRASGIDVDGETMALVAAGTVRRCAQCQERALVAAGGYPGREATLSQVDLANRLERMERLLVTVEGRTRHLLVSEREARVGRLAASLGDSAEANLQAP